MINYDEFCSELEKTTSLLTSEIRKINQKNDLTPGELNSLKEAVCVMEKVLKFEMMLEDAWGEDEEDEYSEYYGRNGGSYRRGGSYARGGGSSSQGGQSGEGSYRRGRSQRTGRYMSRENGNSMRGSSRHSLNDRMIANLESMMDEAGSDFEREKIGEWIDKIRTAPEN